MKQEHRQTKRPVIESELYDSERPQKKRGKRKLFSVYTTGIKSKFFPEGEFCLGHYDTLARAQQALKSLSRTWNNCVIKTK